MSRMRRVPVLILAALLQVAPGTGGAMDTPPSAPAPAKPAASATVAETIAQVLASEKLQRDTLARLEQPAVSRDLPERLGLLEREVDTLAANAKATAEAMQPLDLDRRLWALHRSATAIADDLGGAATTSMSAWPTVPSPSM